MSVIIVFPNGTDWFKANWVFRQLAEDVSKSYPLDTEVNAEMEKAQAIGALFLNEMEKSLVSKVTDSLRTVAQDTLDGKIDGWRAEDECGHRMYLESLTELLNLLQQQQAV